MRAYALRWIALLLVSAAAALIWFALPFLTQTAELPLVGAGAAERQDVFKLPLQDDEPAGDGTAILSRPLFQPTRRPFVPAPLAVEEPLVESDPPSEQVLAEPAPEPEAAPSYGDPAQLRLMGVLLSGSRTSALIATPDKPEGMWFVLGNDVIGWTIDAIGPNAVTLKVGDQSHVIQHYQQGSE